MQKIIDKLERGYNPARLLPVDLSIYPREDRVTFTLILIKFGLEKYL